MAALLETGLLFKEISVWKRINEDTLIRYRCFEQLPDGGFCVQSADFYNLPVDQATIQYHEREFLERLAESSPATRSGLVYASLLEAIAAHEAYFNE